MSLRGQIAIAGIGELANTRSSAGRTHKGLLADSVAMALADAGITKDEVDGLIAEPRFGEPGLGFAFSLAEYLGIKPNYATATNENAATFVATAAAAIHAGYCNTVLCINGAVLEAPRGFPPRDPIDNQFVDAYGPVVAANGWYALIARRHAFEYGTTDEQRAKVAADQRFNAQGNPRAFFNGQPATAEDILKSRLIADPLHLLECVMPAAGAVCVVVTTAERARNLRQKPVYLLGAGQHNWRAEYGWFRLGDRMTDSPTQVAARRAFQMAGVGPKDMDMAQVYDCYTITVMVTLEDAGFIPKGEAGPWYAEHDTTYKGDFPVNTGGGQLSNGQSVAGNTQIAEAVRQLRGGAGLRQIPNHELCYVNT